MKDANDVFHFDFRDKVVLDIGSSTGGFTAYALEHGAKQVIAVEKGTNQMAAPLRFHKKIELHEKTDIFDFNPTKMPDVIVADVSFISLTHILDFVKCTFASKIAGSRFISSRSDNSRLSAFHLDLLVMLKPQFEARPEDLHKGVVKNEKIRRRIIKDFELWLKRHNFVIVKKRDNELTGKTGNRERFYWLKI